MTDKKQQNENIIRGSCTDFVCGYCMTKYGWEHQIWCDNASLVEPQCEDCRYYNARRKSCGHPARRSKRRDMRNERDKHSL